MAEVAVEAVPAVDASVIPEPKVAWTPVGIRRRFMLTPQDPLRAGELARSCAVSPAVGQVLLNRGFTQLEGAKLFLDPKLAHLTRPDGMVDRARAAARLAEAVRAREHIVVFGDYDVDGTTSATILS